MGECSEEGWQGISREASRGRDKGQYFGICEGQLLRTPMGRATDSNQARGSAETQEIGVYHDANLVVSSLNAVPRKLGQMDEEGRALAGSCGSIGGCLPEEWGEEEGQGIVGSEISVESRRRPDCGQHEVEDYICLAYHSVLTSDM